jgi:hypothetical protein
VFTQAFGPPQVAGSKARAYKLAGHPGTRFSRGRVSGGAILWRACLNHPSQKTGLAACLWVTTRRIRLSPQNRPLIKNCGVLIRHAVRSLSFDESRTGVRTTTAQNAQHLRGSSSPGRTTREPKSNNQRILRRIPRRIDLRTLFSFFLVFLLVLLLFDNLLDIPLTHSGSLRDFLRTSTGVFLQFR